MLSNTIKYNETINVNTKETPIIKSSSMPEKNFSAYKVITLWTRKIAKELRPIEVIKGTFFVGARPSKAIMKHAATP